ncbi:MAG: hypothetical protein MUF60_06770 [Vicinamibacterales bacterium]|jgi:hypothetical protein|nr:hypothetical protein [Vicinamibacterales bacterium]
MDRPAVEQFVRGTLGCACPDDVFRSVTISRAPAATGLEAYTEILVGARLLIRILSMPAEPAAPGWIERLATEGRAARDRRGCNRFRLVLAAPAGEQPSGFVDLATRFARSTAGDERAHLHLLAATQLPAELSPARVPAGTAAGAAVTVAK